MGGQSAVPSPGLDLVTFLQVTVLRVFVVVQDVNDNAPEFPFTIKKHDVAEVSPVEPEQVPPEYGGVSGGHRQGDFYTEATAWLDQLLLHPQDTRVGSIVIPGTELEAKDADKDDTLIYTLQEVTPVSASPVPTHYRPLPSDASRPQSLHLPESQVVPSPPLSGRQQLLLPGGAKQPCSEAGEDPGFLQDSEHDPQAAGTGKQTTVPESWIFRPCPRHCRPDLSELAVTTGYFGER